MWELTDMHVMEPLLASEAGPCPDEVWIVTCCQPHIDSQGRYSSPAGQIPLPWGILCDWGYPNPGVFCLVWGSIYGWKELVEGL